MYYGMMSLPHFSHFLEKAGRVLPSSSQFSRNLDSAFRRYIFLDYSLRIDSKYSVLTSSGFQSWLVIQAKMLSRNNCLAGLPDVSFNKKPNSAKKRPGKGQTECLNARRKHNFVCGIATPLYQKYSNHKNIIKNFLRHLDYVLLGLVLELITDAFSDFLLTCKIEHFGISHATFKKCRRGHTPFVQAAAETSDTGAGALRRTHAVLGRAIP